MYNFNEVINMYEFSPKGQFCEFSSKIFKRGHCQINKTLQCCFQRIMFHTFCYKAAVYFCLLSVHELNIQQLENYLPLENISQYSFSLCFGGKYILKTYPAFCKASSRENAVYHSIETSWILCTKKKY